MAIRRSAVLLAAVLLAAGVGPVGAQTSAPTSDRTTVIVVRHAEKLADEGDPSLSTAGVARAEALSRTLAHLPVTVLFASQYKRTQETLAPLASQFGIPVQVHDARDVVGLAGVLRSQHAGQVVVVAGHSNTVPDLMRALGVESVSDMSDQQYEDLFVVRLHPDGSATALHFNYGAPSDP